MSTSWGYRCLDCGEDSPTWIAHGEDFLKRLYHERESILKVYELTQKDKDLWRIELNIISVYDEPYPLEFLTEHGDHRLQLVNEYNQAQEIPPA